MHSRHAAWVEESWEYVRLPPKRRSALTQTKDCLQALPNFLRVSAIRPVERVLMLIGPLLDPHMVDAMSGLVRAGGAAATLMVCASVTAGRNPVIGKGFQMAPRDPDAFSSAGRYGDPEKLLEALV